jgi:hypothetical protein
MPNSKQEWSFIMGWVCHFQHNSYAVAELMGFGAFSISPGL